MRNAETIGKEINLGHRVKKSEVQRGGQEDRKRMEYDMMHIKKILNVLRLKGVVEPDIKVCLGGWRRGGESAT